MEKLQLVEIRDVQDVNEILATLNDSHEANIGFNKLTPMMLLLIFDAFKRLNPHHMNTFSIDIDVNGKNYKMNPMDFDHINIFHENEICFIQIYGWNHVGFSSQGDMMPDGIYLKADMVCTALSYSVIDRDMLKKHNPMYAMNFAPKAPNGFIDFNFNQVDKDNSYMDISFPENSDCVYGHMHLCFKDVPDNIEYITT